MPQTTASEHLTVGAYARDHLTWNDWDCGHPGEGCKRC